MAWEKSIIVSYEEAFKRELLSFHECIVEGCTPLTSGIEGRRDLVVLQAIAASAARRQFVTINGPANTE